MGGEAAAMPALADAACRVFRACRARACVPTPPSGSMSMLKARYWVMLSSARRAEDVLPGGALAPGPAPGRAGGPSGQPEEQMVTFQLEVIGPGAQARPASFVGSLRVGLGNFTKITAAPAAAPAVPGAQRRPPRPAGWAPARGPAAGALPAGSASARTQRPPAAAGRRSARRAPPSRPPPSGADAARQLLHARASWPGHPGRARAADAAPRGARRRAPRSCRRRSSMRSPTCSPAARLTT